MNSMNQLKLHLFTLFPAIVTFYLPSKFVIATVIILMLVDTYWGIKLAKHKEIEITSNRASDFFAKFIGYFIFITFGLFLSIEFEISHIIWISAIVPVYSELYSIDEKQRHLGKLGIFKKIENTYKFAVKIKGKRDKLRS